MSATPNPTPSDVKWLANELAATKGELERIDEEIARLRARQAQLKAVCASLSKVAALVRRPELGDVVPAVRAHPARGGRGSIVDFVRAVLRAAHPSALDTRSLTEMVIEHFGLKFASAQERNRFRKATVSHTLQRLVNIGQVERLHDVKSMPNSPGLWRWRAEQPTIVELLAMEPKLVGDDPWL